MNGSEPQPTKELDAQQAVASVWRPIFEAVVAAFIAGDWELSSAPACFERLPPEDALSMQQIVRAYGDITLAPLPTESWDTSVAVWMGTGWQLLVDLFAEEEGRTDLVLGAVVTEGDEGYGFKVHFLYVP